MSHPINLLSTDDILAELKRRKLAEIIGYRTEIAERTEAIKALRNRIEALKGY